MKRGPGVVTFLLVGALTASTACRRTEAPKHEPAAAGALRFIEDDYERARTEAVRRRVPLFVDVWASWCRLYLLKADVLIAAGDRAAARAALEEALAFARTAGLASQYDRLRETIERRVRELP